MRADKNRGIEFEVYDEFFAIDLIEQKEFQTNNDNDTKTIKRRKLKDEVSTYVLCSSAVCSALLSQVIDVI
jgi:hypothetical protein